MSRDSTRAPLPVVCALIEHDGRVLLAQRPAGKHLGGKWEFPGGKVEPGEAPAAALCREIREELGCDIDIGRALPPRAHHYESVSIELMPFLCRLRAASPAPESREHAALKWVRPDELAAHDLAPADLPVVRDYLRSMNDTPTNPDPHMLRRQLIAAGRAALAENRRRFDADAAAAARRTREAFRTCYGDLRATLGGPLNARKVGEGEGAGFRFENLLFESHAGWEVNATLYLPKDSPGPWPAVVVPVGHSGKQFASYQLPCQHFARAGFAAITFDPPGVAGEKQPGNDHFADGVRCYLIGDTSNRYFIGDVLRAMDYLETRADIDARRGFACTGVSGGGNSSVYAALLDDRITAIAPSCCQAPQASLVLERSYSSCPETLMSGRLRDGLDDADLLAALAPRPVLMMAGKEDEVFLVAESRAVAEQATIFFERLGAAGRFTYFEDEGGHAYSLRQAGQFCAWLREQWQLPSGPLPSTQPDDYTLLPAEALQCHPDMQVNMRSLTQKRLAAFATEHTAPDRAFLQTIADIATTAPATPLQPRSAALRTWFYDWREWMLHPEPGIAVPVSSADCADAVATLWHFNPAGRLALAASGGLLTEAIGHLDRNGPKANLLAADLRGWGESAVAAMPYEFVSWGAPDRFLAYVSAALGDPVEAARLRDAWHLYRARPAVKRNVLYAVGAAGPVALHFAALTGNLSAVVLQDAPGSYADLLATEDLNWPHDIILPGALRHYDLPLLAGAANCPVHWVNARDGAGVSLPPDECARRSRDRQTWHPPLAKDDFLKLLRALLYD